MSRGWIVALLLVVASPLAATAETVAERWRREFDRVDALLVESQWRKAEKQTQRLRNSMFQKVVGGGEGWLGLLAAFQAVALEGKGDSDQAAWMWGVARQLAPELENLDLAKYGVVGERLRDHPPVEGSSFADAFGKQITRPKPRKRPKPHFPEARLFRGRTVSLSVACFVDLHGVPREPKIVEAKGEYTLIYSALETLGTWRFEPARAAGTPVTIFYNLTVNFKVP